ncbi:hypothetical protein [Veillonella sp. T11011-6]|uniref:hypothetical protein n=1 Tax=Veillonella sp. T11011-6 TaxID=2027459 RepID=UPI000CF4270A|nr:hypothetical protein [Veillonella sp. T11011-6]PQL09802.1 hypothetical protein VRHSUH10_04640 [Veillonella sp. T11011-6]
MKKIEMLGYFWVFTSISLCIGLYKLELSKRVFDEEYEYIKKHRAFGNLTKYLIIIAIVSVVLLNCKFLIDKDYLFIARYGVAWSIFVLLIMCTGFYQKRNSLYYKRGLLAIFSILIGIAGSGYALKSMFFK